MERWWTCQSLPEWLCLVLLPTVPPNVLQETLRSNPQLVFQPYGSRCFKPIDAFTCNPSHNAFTLFCQSPLLSE